MLEKSEALRLKEPFPKRCTDMKRIGMALSAPRGPTQRRSQYGIYDSGLCQYEGYRELCEDGEAQVGLPLSGPNAAHLQPCIAFNEAHYDEIRWFEGSLKTRFDRINASEGDVDGLVRKVTAMRSWVELEISLRDHGYIPTIILYPDDPEHMKTAKAALTEIIRSKGYQVWEGSKGRKVQRAG